MKIRNLFLAVFLALAVCVPIQGQPAPSSNPTQTGATDFYVGQASVTTSATNVLPTSYPNQRGWIIRNTDSTNPIYIGKSASLTTSNGFLIKAGETLSLPTIRNIWAISTGGTVTICWIAPIN